MSSTSEQFLKREDIMESKFLISVNHSFSVIQIAAVCEHITGDVNIYLYGCVGLLAPESAVCLCVCMCVISSQSTSKKQYYVSDLSKLDALLHKTHSRVLLVLRYRGLTGVDP